MIGWTRLVLATAWVMSASLACAGATPRPSTPDPVRSPPLDYGDGPRSADDGAIMGAHGVSTQDWLLGGATPSHLGPGWSLGGGRLHFELEQVRAGGSGPKAAPACPPGSAPLTADEMETDAALRRAWLEAARWQPSPPLARAIAELPDERSGLLTCDTR
jgi:hypothetical protein